MRPKIKTPFTLFYILLILILKGFVFSVLWGWFIVPLGFPIISFPTGIGIASMFMLLTHLPIWHFENYEEEFKYNITIGIKPIVLLLIGYLIHSWPQIFNTLKF